MSAGTESVVRFSTRQRLEHAAVMVLFTLLAVTGFPQKFSDWGLSLWVVNALGGIEITRWIHRAAGVAFVALTVSHLAAAILQAVLRRGPLSMVPTRKDFTDVVVMLRYYLRRSEERARFDRYDYREKFEYWGLVFGALIMSATGLVLLFPLPFARWLAGELIPVAKLAHSQEGLMAFLVVITWHVYNAHLAPEVFPFNRTIFTGRIEKERLRHEHALEYARLFPEEASAGAEPSDRPFKIVGGSRHG